jgi:hypothetical protein
MVDVPAAAGANVTVPLDNFNDVILLLLFDTCNEPSPVLETVNDPEAPSYVTAIDDTDVVIFAAFLLNVTVNDAFVAL